MKKVFIVLIVLVLLVFVALQFNTKTEVQKPSIVVTSYIIDEIARALLKDRVEVKRLIPNGVDMHSFTPTPKTMSDIHNADLFIYTGLGMEPWIKEQSQNGFDIAENIYLLKPKHNEKHEEAHEEGHDHGEEDPHYWLDIDNIMRMTEGISLKLQRLYPELTQEITMNQLAFLFTLNEMKGRYSKGLKECKKREIVVNHNAFGYLAGKYDFDVHSVIGLSSDEQPSAKKLKEIVDLVKEEKINTIFFESYVNNAIASSIAKETGVAVESLHTLASVTNEDATKGLEALMEENFAKLHFALECE